MRIERGTELQLSRAAFPKLGSGCNCGKTGSDCSCEKSGTLAEPQDALDDGTRRRAERKLTRKIDEQVRELPDKTRITEFTETSEEPGGFNKTVQALEYDLPRDPQQAKAAHGSLDPARLLALFAD